MPDPNEQTEHNPGPPDRDRNPDREYTFDQHKIEMARDTEAKRVSATQAAQDERAIDENSPLVQSHMGAFESRMVADKAAEAQRVDAYDGAVRKRDIASDNLRAAHADVKAARERLAAVQEEWTKACDGVTRLGVPNVSATPAEVLKPNEPTVLMFFPRAVSLIADNHTNVTFPAGIHPVPESVQYHHWLFDNGVRPYKGKVPEPKAAEHTEPVAQTDDEFVDQVGDREQPPIRKRTVDPVLGA